MSNSPSPIPTPTPIRRSARIAATSTIKLNPKTVSSISPVMTNKTSKKSQKRVGKQTSAAKMKDGQRMIGGFEDPFVSAVDGEEPLERFVLDRPSLPSFSLPGPASVVTDKTPTPTPNQDQARSFTSHQLGVLIPSPWIPFSFQSSTEEKWTEKLEQLAIKLDRSFTERSKHLEIKLDQSISEMEKRIINKLDLLSLDLNQRIKELVEDSFEVKEKIHDLGRSSSDLKEKMNELDHNTLHINEKMFNHLDRFSSGINEKVNHHLLQRSTTIEEKMGRYFDRVYPRLDELEGLVRGSKEDLVGIRNEGDHDDDDEGGQHQGQTDRVALHVGEVENAGQKGMGRRDEHDRTGDEDVSKGMQGGDMVDGQEVRQAAGGEDVRERRSVGFKDGDHTGTISSTELDDQNTLVLSQSPNNLTPAIQGRSPPPSPASSSATTPISPIIKPIHSKTPQQGGEEDHSIASPRFCIQPKAKPRWNEMYDRYARLVEYHDQLIGDTIADVLRVGSNDVEDGQEE